MSEAGSDFDRDNSNLMRIKVNRVNMMQTLKIDDDFLSNLMKRRILYFEEARGIMAGRSREEKVKNLIECMMTRVHTRKDWYSQFRSLLIEKNYKDLVTFLDNTITGRPRLASKLNTNFNAQTESQVSADSQFEFEKTKDLSNIYKAFCFKIKSDNYDEFDEKKFGSLLENLPTYSEPPEYLINELKTTINDDDNKQILKEQEAFDSFRKLELLYSMYMIDKSSFKDTFFLDTFIAYKIVNSYNAHMHMKYYKNLEDKYNIDMLNFLKEFLIEHLKSERVIRLKLYETLDELVYKLTWTLIRNEKYHYAKQLLEEYLKYLDFLEEYLKTLNEENNNLNKDTKNSQSSILTIKFYALSNLIIVNNYMLNYKEAYVIYEKSNILLENIRKTDEEVNCTNFFYGMGNILLEQGYLNSSFEYLNNSLMNCSFYDDIIVDLLGAASLCYSSKWMIAKAESLAILGVQTAKYFYGRNHSQFVRALQFYCYFSNEYIQDNSSMKVCEFLLSLAKNVFGYDSIDVADAYRSLSKALIINKIFDYDRYYEYAQRAHKIATDHHGKDSPKLICYQLSLGLALQWKSINSNIIEIKKVNINDAYNLSVKALNSCITVFGEKNIQTAKIYRLVGSILYYMERDSDSEEYNKRSYQVYKECLSNDDLHYLISKSNYGIFLKMVGKFSEAIEVLLEVVNNMNVEELNNIVSYCKWIPSIYLGLSECYRIKKVNDLADYYHKQAENLIKLTNYRNNLRADLLTSEMNRRPPSSLNEYLRELFEQK